MNLDQTKLALLLVADWQLEKVVEAHKPPMAFKSRWPIRICMRMEKLYLAGPSPVSYGFKHESYPYGSAWAMRIKRKGDSPQNGIPFVLGLECQVGQTDLGGHYEKFGAFGRRFYRPQCFVREHVGWDRDEWEHGIMWQMEDPGYQYPDHMLPNLPCITTPRGLRIIHQVFLDIDNIIHGRAIQYLAVYSRDLITGT